MEEMISTVKDETIRMKHDLHGYRELSITELLRLEATIKAVGED